MPLAAIAIVSAGVLAYEVLLMRLFAIIQWHHFAYMVISIALLGYGASGTFLAFTRERLSRAYPLALAANAALFGLTALAAFALVQWLPFNPLEVVWAPAQLWYLGAYYLLFAVPFFCAANCVGLSFASLPARIGAVYRADLTGAGAGALGIVALLFAIPAAGALRAIALAGLGAAVVAALAAPRRIGIPLIAGLALAAGVIALALPPAWTALMPSQFKALQQALLIPGTRVVAERSSPLGLVSVVESPRVPLRHAPGLSLTSAGEPPAQLGVFVDGEGPSAITAFDGRLAPLSYLGDTTSAAPYRLLDAPRTLVLGAGGGADVLQALYHGARSVDAVELDPAVVDLVRESFADFAGHLYDRPDVHVHIAEARGFVAGARARYDLIQMPLLDSLAAATLGSRGLSESYLYTVEALGDYLDRLAPGGWLAITRWVRVPPRDALKLFATAAEALRATGAAPAASLAALRSWSTITLLVKNGAITGEDVARLKSFADARSFDLAYAPGMGRAEANRFNVLDAPYFYDAMVALLGPDRARFVERYKFDITPATDDRPYFFDFFRWRALPELLAIRAQGGAGMLDWGYLILCATLVQALGLALVLVLVPLGFRRTGIAPVPGRGAVALYFLAIGLAFLFVEVASIQRFILFLSHPLYAVAVVLCAFLVFAGLGAGVAPRLAERRGPRATVAVAVAAIAITALVYLAALPPLFASLMGLGDAAKVAISLALIAPLAFWMGMPFPLALQVVARRAPALVPWAWGVNGCASVASAVLAALLAMSFGFSAVVLIALALYGLAAASFLRFPAAES
ncbi:MAG TPA: SAM-dependent methyltransferase [Alphaproteobacteria bacterium]